MHTTGIGTLHTATFICTDVLQIYNRYLLLVIVLIYYTYRYTICMSHGGGNWDNVQTVLTTEVTR